MILERQMKADHSVADSNLNKMVGVPESQIQYPYCGNWVQAY